MNEKEKLWRLRLVLDTELSAKNKFQAIVSLTAPVFRYSFGIVNWRQEELQTLHRKTRKLLTIHGQHHPKADLDCLYIRRIQGGRGLMQLEEAYTVPIMKLVEYIDRKENPLLQFVRMHQHINSAVLLKVRCLKTALQGGTKQSTA